MKLHPGLEWRIFHIRTSEDTDDAISRLYNTFVGRLKSFTAEQAYVSTKKKTL